MPFCIASQKGEMPFVIICSLMSPSGLSGLSKVAPVDAVGDAPVPAGRLGGAGLPAVFSSLHDAAANIRATADTVEINLASLERSFMDSDLLMGIRTQKAPGGLTIWFGDGRTFRFSQSEFL